MPKIRLSALAVDMKGKAGGSVFSRNSGGVYFRNNKTGGGKKSATWDKQKANLAAISRAWKSLTIEEQDAWSAAAADYPAQTVWGDTRQPSGYELYSRLNGVLQGAGLSVLTTPISPRSIVDMGETELVYPDLYQFQPQRVLNMLDQPITFGQQQVIGSISDFKLETSEALTFHLRASMEFPLYPTTKTSRSFSLFGNALSTSPGFQVYITLDDDGTKTLTFIMYDSTHFSKCFCVVPETFDFSNFTLTITSVSSDLQDAQIYLNGSAQGLNYDNQGSVGTDYIDQDLILGSINNEHRFYGYLSDFRIYRSALSAANVLLISNNYTLGTEYLRVPLQDFTPSNAPYTFQDACEDDTDCAYGYMCINGTCTLVESGETPSFDLDGYNSTWYVYGNPNKTRVLKNWSPGYVPTMSLTVEFQNLSGTYLQVYASPPMSSGIISRTANVKLIGTFEYGDNTEFEITEAYRALYPNVPGGSSIQFFLVVVDSQTGVNTTKAAPKKPKRTRFKAGAELSGSVN